MFQILYAFRRFAVVPLCARRSVRRGALLLLLAVATLILGVPLLAVQATTPEPIPQPRSVNVSQATSGSLTKSTTPNPVPSTRSTTAVPSGSPPIGSPRMIGIHTAQSPWDGGTDLDAFTADARAKPAIDMWYQNWTSACCSLLVDSYKFNVVTSRGSTPMVSWSPCDAGLTIGNNLCDDDVIAGTNSGGTGPADSYLRQSAKDAAAYGKPLFIRLAWEMNGDWFGWSPGTHSVDGRTYTNTAASYVRMWNHVHDIFGAAGATNVRWVWSPNTYGQINATASYAQLYPGDGYVDWVAMDGYNWGTVKGGVWETFTNEFAQSYDTLVAMTAKPIMIAEVGSSEHGGDKAAWIRSAFLTEIPQRLPKLSAVLWFNENKETDWRVESSSAALAAWRQVVASPSWQGGTPSPTATPIPASPTATPATATPPSTPAPPTRGMSDTTSGIHIGLSSSVPNGSITVGGVSHRDVTSYDYTYASRLGGATSMQADNDWSTTLNGPAWWTAPL